MSRRFFRWSVAFFLCSLVVYAVSVVRALPTHVFLFGNHVSYFDEREGPITFTFAHLYGNLHGNEAVAAAFQSDMPVTDNIHKEMTVSVLGIPVRNVAATVVPDTKVVPMGMTVGIRIDITGLLVLGTGAVTTKDGESVHPSEGRVKAGDIITKIDDRELTDHTQIQEHLAAHTPGESVTLSILRGGEMTSVDLTPVLDEDSSVKIGLWVRDSAKGIGTITYVNPADSSLGALGHGVIDVDTKQLIPIKQGHLYRADVVAVKRGKKGSPGELVGDVDLNAPIGRITQNTNVGLFGTVDKESPITGTPMKIALRTDVREGPATILSNVNGSEIRQYDIFIERVNRFAEDDSKGMVIRITDQGLISRTNGIVQGMSGCPIIQNGRVIGAVTHVFVQNPLRGYGIFIENMMKR